MYGNKCVFFFWIFRRKKIVALVKYNRLSESYVKSQKFIPKLNFLEFIVLVIKTTKSPIFYCGRIVSNLGNDLLFAPNFGIFTFIFRCVVFFALLEFFFLLDFCKQIWHFVQIQNEEYLSIDVYWLVCWLYYYRHSSTWNINRSRRWDNVQIYKEETNYCVRHP